MLAFACRNCWKHLLVQGRWTNVYLTAFYSLTIMCAVTRMLYFYSELVIIFNPSEHRLTENRISLYTSGLALTLQAILGACQVGQMVELGIRVQLSVRVIDEQTLKKKVMINRIFLCLSILLLLVAFGIEVKATYDMIEESYQVPAWEIDWITFFEPVTLITLSVFLCSASIYLVCIVKRYPVGLKAEACRVQTIFIVFTVAYLTRAVTFAVVHFVFEFSNPHFEISLIYYIGYNFWDVVPLTIIMIFHYRNFVPKERSQSDFEALRDTMTCDDSIALPSISSKQVDSDS